MTSLLNWTAPNGARVIRQGNIDTSDMTRVCWFNKAPDPRWSDITDYWYHVDGRFLGQGPRLKPPGDLLDETKQYKFGRTKVRILTVAALGDYPVIFTINGVLLRADAWGRTEDGKQLREVK